MKKLEIVTLVAIAALAGTSTFAMWPRGGQGAGQWQGAWQAQCVDSNNNGVCDGQEDFDGDGIPNNQDEDYKTYQNAPENGQLQSNQYKGANKGGVNAQGVNAPKTGTGSMGANAKRNWNMEKVQQAKQVLAQKRNQYAQNLGNIAPKVDEVLAKYFDKLSALPVEDQISKLQTLLEKIDAAEEKIQSITDEEKKELYTNLLEYLKVAVQEKLVDLTSDTSDTETEEDVLDSILE